MKCYFVLLLLAIASPSSADQWLAADWQSVHSSGTQAEFNQALQSSPVVKFHEGASTRNERKIDEVDVHFINYNFFTIPGDPDFKKSHLIGKGSKPKYKFTKQAGIVIYMTTMDDEKGVLELRAQAAKIGADAIVDVIKIPYGDYNEARIYGNYVIQPRRGYTYFGTAVIRK